MKTLLLITIALLNISVIRAQFVPEWTTVHNPGTPSMNVHYVDQSGNCYVSGSKSETTTGFDIITIKFNSLGIVQWTRTYNSFQDNYDDPFSVFSDTEGNVYVFGNSYRSINFTNSIVMIKYNSNGSLIGSYSFQRPGMDYTAAQKVVFVNNTEFVITGFASSETTDSIITFKVNKNGIILWNKTISGTRPGLSNDNSNDIVSDSLGNIYIVGELVNIDNKYDAITAKYDPSGNLVWSQTYGLGSNYDERAFRLALDNLLNVYATGYVNITSGQDEAQTLILKYNSLGQEQWAYNFNISNNGTEYGTKIMVSTNDIYVHVVSANIQKLLKVNSSGTQQWLFDFQNSPQYMALNNSNRLNISGFENGYFRKVLSFQQLNPSGTIDFKYRYNYLTTGSDIGGFFKDLGNGSYLVTGTHDTSMLLIKLNPAQFTTNTVSSSRTGLNKPILDNQTTYDTITFNLDVLPPNTYISGVSLNIDSILHTAAGDLEISLLHNGQEDTLVYRRGGSFDNFIDTKLNDTASQFICSSGNSPFTGYYSPCKPFSQLNNFPATGPWILKIYDRRSPDTGVLKSWTLNVTYQTLIGLTQVSSQVPKAYLLSQNYPNPFNPVTKIKFSIPKSTLVKVVIYDLTGREIETLVDQQLSAGEYETDFDGSELSSGVYFYKLVANEFSESKKMVLVK